MNAELRGDLPGPAMVVRALVAEYGAVRVVLALIRHLAGRHALARRIRETELSDHIRRDIGLDPRTQGRRYWEL